MSDVKHADKRTETHECVSERTETHDLISRKAATHALCKRCDLVNDDTCGEKCIDIKILEKLPSAEPQWILISERMPEDEGWYLVTDDSGGVLWLVVEHYDPEFGLQPFCTIQNPVAWMPLPEPYRGGENE